MTSYARLAPNKPEYMKCFIPQLHENLMLVYDLPHHTVESNPMLVYGHIPDIDMYVNLWLTLATFTTRLPNYQKLTSIPQAFAVLTKDLIKVFGSNQRWNATEINI